MENLPKPLGTGKGWPKTKAQKEFCWLVVVEGHSAIEAAKLAGYSEKTALKQASRSLKQFAKYCEQLQAHKNVAMQKRMEITVDSVADEFGYLAFASHKDYVRIIDFDGMKRAIGKPIDELTDQQARAIQSWDVRPIKCPRTKTTYLDYRYTLYSKDGSLMHLGKHLGMFNDKMIIERRMVKVHKFDLSGVPDQILQKWMKELASYQARPVIEGQKG